MQMRKEQPEPGITTHQYISKYLFSYSNGLFVGLVYKSTVCPEKTRRVAANRFIQFRSILLVQCPAK